MLAVLAILAFRGWALLAAAVVAVIAAALVRGTAPATAVTGPDDRHVVALRSVLRQREADRHGLVAAE